MFIEKNPGIFTLVVLHSYFISPNRGHIMWTRKHSSRMRTTRFCSLGVYSTPWIPYALDTLTLDTLPPIPRYPAPTLPDTLPPRYLPPDTLPPGYPTPPLDTLPSSGYPTPPLDTLSLLWIPYLSSGYPISPLDTLPLGYPTPRRDMGPEILYPQK